MGQNMHRVQLFRFVRPRFICLCRVICNLHTTTISTMDTAQVIRVIGGNEQRASSSATCKLFRLLLSTRSLPLCLVCLRTRTEPDCSFAAEASSVGSTYRHSVWVVSVYLFVWWWARELQNADTRRGACKWRSEWGTGSGGGRGSCAWWGTIEQRQTHERRTDEQLICIRQKQSKRYAKC